MTSSPVRRTSSGSWFSRKDGLVSRSGDTSSTSTSSAASCSRTVSHSSWLAELMATARTPARAAAATWSRIRASSGDTISVGPAPRRRSSRLETKYTADLPQPVRCTTRARRPPSTRASIASNWPSWNSAAGCPTSSRSTSWACSRVPDPADAEADRVGGGGGAGRTAAFWLLAIASVSQPPPTATKPGAHG